MKSSQKQYGYNNSQDFKYHSQSKGISSDNSIENNRESNVIPFTKEWEWYQCCYNSVE